MTPELRPVYDVFDPGRPLRPRVRMCERCANRAERIAQKHGRRIVIDGPVGDGVCQAINCVGHGQVDA